MEDVYPRFASIPRWYKDFVITEKVDGTNALIEISADGNIRAGSRTRWITPDQDNFGFAAWVRDNADELRDLGPGRHYGEWYGKGIQRSYGLDRRCFALFNTGRWSHDNAPECCDVVPVLGSFSGDSINLAIEESMTLLFQHGSLIAPGFMRPEGIVIYSVEAKAFWKKTLDNDRAGQKYRKGLT